jgi:hypothetical protein
MIPRGEMYEGTDFETMESEPTDFSSLNSYSRHEHSSRQMPVSFYRISSQVMLHSGTY